MTDIRTLGFLLVGAALLYLMGRWIWGLIWYRFLNRVLTTLLLSAVVLVGAALIIAPKAAFNQLMHGVNFVKGLVVKPTPGSAVQAQIQNAVLGKGASGPGFSLPDILNPFAIAQGAAPHDSPMFNPQPQAQNEQSSNAPETEPKHAHKKIVTTLAQ